jgi:hypothetical protein
MVGGGTGHGRGRIDVNDPMADSREIPSESSFAAADVDCQTAR